MAGLGGAAAMGCNDQCGCAVPCPGGEACKCVESGRRDETAAAEHLVCSCGEHCACNPCTCAEGAETRATGRHVCSCGTGCTCSSCAASQ